MSNTVTPATNKFSLGRFLKGSLALAALSRAGSAAPQDVTTYCGLTIGESQPSEWSLCTAKTDGGQTKFTAWSTEAANVVDLITNRTNTLNRVCTEPYKTEYIESANENGLYINKTVCDTTFSQVAGLNSLFMTAPANITQTQAQIIAVTDHCKNSFPNDANESDYFGYPGLRLALECAKFSELTASATDDTVSGGTVEETENENKTKYSHVDLWYDIGHALETLPNRNDSADVASYIAQIFIVIFTVVGSTTAPKLVYHLCSSKPKKDDSAPVAGGNVNENNKTGTSCLPCFKKNPAADDDNAALELTENDDAASV